MKERTFFMGTGICIGLVLGVIIGSFDWDSTKTAEHDDYFNPTPIESRQVITKDCTYVLVTAEGGDEHQRTLGEMIVMDEVSEYTHSQLPNVKREIEERASAKSGSTVIITIPLIKKGKDGSISYYLPAR